MALFPNSHYKRVSILASGWAPLSPSELSGGAFRRVVSSRRRVCVRVQRWHTVVCYASRRRRLANALKLHASRIHRCNSRETVADVALWITRKAFLSTHHLPLSPSHPANVREITKSRSSKEKWESGNRCISRDTGNFRVLVSQGWNYWSSIVNESKINRSRILAYYACFCVFKFFIDAWKSTVERLFEYLYSFSCRIVFIYFRFATLKQRWKWEINRD